MACLLLWLEGPLQSWGHDSLFRRRETLSFPTRSGITGLLCNALGIENPEEERDFLEKMMKVRMYVAAYAPTWGADPELRDYHMVGAGYDDNDPWEDMMIPKTIRGSKPSNCTGPILTTRYYLQNTAFACILEFPEDLPELASHVSKSLQKPARPLYLGRKCCCPTDFVWQDEFECPDAAFAKAGKIAESKNREEKFRVMEKFASDNKNDCGENRFISDVPVSFNPGKKYLAREILIIPSTVTD